MRFRDEFLSSCLYLVFMDVPDGTNGDYAAAERVYRDCGMDWIPGFADFCYAYSAGWIKNILLPPTRRAGVVAPYTPTAPSKREPYKYIFSAGSDCLFICDYGMGAVMVYVGADMGETFSIAV